MRNTSVGRAGPGLRAKTLWVLVLVALVGCGGARRVNLSIQNQQDRTYWVVVALLDDPSALDGYSTQKLIDDRDEVESLQGVVDLIVTSVNPGLALNREFSTATFPLETGWVVATALLPGEPECAWKRVTIDTGSELTFSISVSNDCLVLEEL